MKNILFIACIALLFISCEFKTKDEIQMEELMSQAEKTNFTMVSDSSAAEERLQKAYIIGPSSEYYTEESYVRNGHLFFGILSTIRTTSPNGNWLVHDPDCPQVPSPVRFLIWKYFSKAGKNFLHL